MAWGDSASFHEERDQIDSIDMLYAALKNRMNAFSDAGCVLSDHAFERMPGLPVGREEFEQIFQSALNGGHIDSMAEERFQTTLLTWLAEQYDMRGLGDGTTSRGIAERKLCCGQTGRAGQRL